MSAGDSVPARTKREMHPESLLHIPLIKQLISDPLNKIQFRGIDANWNYKRAIPTRIGGFNPYLSTVYLPGKSSFAQWLKDPYVSGRWYNDQDTLMQEALFAVHDYLHVWSVHAINSIYPELGFGTRPITAENLEDFTFCHLLTETAATVGLDYWYLATVDLNKVCNVGTRLRGITVNYREDLVDEYRKWNVRVEVQRKEFFGDLAKFYCQGGSFMGAWTSGLERNPMTYFWLNHEMTYGEVQRRYSRLWLSYLAEGNVPIARDQWTAPVSVEGAWKSRLISELGEMLWEKVKEGALHDFSGAFDPESSWRSSPRKDPDFRFLNFNAMENAAVQDVAIGRDADENFKYLFHQYVSGFEYDKFDKELVKLFRFLLAEKDFGLVEHLFKGQIRVGNRDPEPRDLFLLN